MAQANQPGQRLALSSSDAGFTGAGGGAGKNAQGPAPGWTNIQEYLKANQGENQTSDYVKNTYGQKIEANDKGLTEAKSKFQEGINQANEVIKGGTGAKQKVAEGAAKGEGANSPWYSQIQNYLKGPQNIPTAVNYNVDQSLLQANSAPGGLLEGTYQQAGLQGPGMYALQRGLDKPNENVQSTVKDTSGKISALQTGATEAATQSAQQAKDVADMWSQGVQTETKGLQDLYGGATAQLQSAADAANARFDAFSPEYEYTYTPTSNSNVGTIMPPGATPGTYTPPGIKGTVAGDKDIVRADLSNVMNLDPNLAIYGNQANTVAGLLGGGMKQVGGGTATPGVTGKFNQERWNAIKAAIEGKGGRILKGPQDKAQQGSNLVMPTNGGGVS